jgi:hypothetical protein
MTPVKIYQGYKIFHESSKLDKSKAEMNTPSQDAILNPTLSLTPINLPDCCTKIAEIAFYKAERRGFEAGHEIDDWIEAEQEFHDMTAKDNSR